MVDMTFGYGGKGKLSAIADIGVGGVSLSIVQTSGVTSTVLATGRSVLSFEPHTPEQSVGMLAAQIKEAGDLALSQYAAHHQKAPILSVHAVIHAPWVHTQTVRAAKRFESDTPAQDSHVAELAKAGLALATEIDQSRLIEASVTRIEVNGYRTKRHENVRVRTLDAVSLISDCEADVKSAVASALGALFPVAKISWRSGARAIAAFVDDTDLSDTDVLIIDMSTDTTHVITLRKGLFEQSIVPEGVRTILARLAGGGLPDATLGHIRMLEREACSNEACEAVQSAMALAEPDLARIFGECIGKMAAVRHVPNDLILITHHDLETWLGRFFTRIDFTQFTITTLPFEVHTPQSLGIENWILGVPQESALAVDTALVNIEADS
ncbi:MAG: hypothetical protein JWM46_753 [Candidatus Kaiserbacteria bacterium]|nr:hypothetical protein [Candidatus Kaiserbacteria bacterium]